MQRSLCILLLAAFCHTFILNLTQHETCLEFTPDYADKKHEVYFLSPRGVGHQYDAYIRVLSPDNVVLNSTQQSPGTHYLSVITKSVDQHRICIYRNKKEVQMSVHLDIVDQIHLQEHTKAGKQDIVKLIRHANLLSTNLGKFQVTQKSLLHNSRISGLELLQSNSGMYWMFLIKTGLILAIVVVHMLMVKRIYR